MTVSTPRILAVEGPDGAGKTSIIRLLSQRLGANAIVPFGGAVGAEMRRLHESGAFEQVNRMGLDTVAEITAAHGHSSLLIFDRHWLSVLAFTSRSFFSLWQPIPPTIVCLADAQVIAERLRARGTTPAELAASGGVLTRYQALAAEYGLPVVNTGGATVEQSVDRFIALWRQWERMPVD
jgi:thymidylate kinase